MHGRLRSTSVEVTELVPPYVQTELVGERQASDPNAVPLAEYVAEVMDILTAQLEAPEICVERVKPLRLAAAEGQEKYDDFYSRFNDMMVKARPDG